MQNPSHSLEPAQSDTTSLSSFGVAKATPLSDKTSSITAESGSMQALGSHKSSRKKYS